MKTFFYHYLIYIVNTEILMFEFLLQNHIVPFKWNFYIHITCFSNIYYSILHIKEMHLSSLFM